MCRKNKKTPKKHQKTAVCLKKQRQTACLNSLKQPQTAKHPLQLDQKIGTISNNQTTIRRLQKNAP